MTWPVSPCKSVIMIKTAIAIYAGSGALKTETPAWSSLSSFIPCIHLSVLRSCPVPADRLPNPPLLSIPASRSLQQPPPRWSHCSQPHFFQAIPLSSVTFFMQELPRFHPFVTRHQGQPPPFLTGLFLVWRMPPARLISSGRALSHCHLHSSPT